MRTLECSQISYTFLYLLFVSQIAGASKAVTHGSDSGRDSIATSVKELLTRENEDLVLGLLCAAFVLNT